MAAEITVKANKRVRGEILTILYSVQPIPVEARTISTALVEGNFISSPDINTFIDYLSNKKYVKILSEEDASQILRGVIPTKAFIKITPKGIDLVEDTIQDAGVDV